MYSYSKFMKLKSKGKSETFYFFSWHMVSKVVTYFVLLVLANSFSVGVYGKVAYAYSIFNLMLLILSVGLPQTFISWTIKKKDSVSVVYFFTFIFLASTVLGIIIFWGNWWVLPLILVLPFFFVQRVADSIFRINHKHHIVQILASLSMFLYLVFLLIFKKYNEVGILTSYALAYFTVAIISFFLTSKEFLNFFKPFRINMQTIKEYVKKGLITIVLLISGSILGYIDSFILGLMSNFENVAEYNIAGPIASVVSIIPTALAMFLLTRSSEINNVKKSRLVLARILRLSLSLSIIFAIFLISIMDTILKILFPQYLNISSFVMVLLLGVMFSMVYYLISIYFSGRLNPEKILIPIVFAAATNLILDILFIPYYGLWGVIIATIIAHAIAMIWILAKAELINLLIPIIIISALVPLAYIIGLKGILLIIPTVPLLFWLKLATLEDLKVFYKELKNILDSIIKLKKSDT